MTIAAKHFDPQLGIDIHLYLIPPSLVPVPLPTPHIGIVLDPFDYVPVIGGTVQVNGIKRATAGSMGLDIHIPVGGAWMPTMKMPMGPQWEDEIFMGSKTVLADSEPFARVAMPVLACNIVGMVAPFRLKPKKPHVSLLLPTTLNLAIPTNVFVGGPPTVSWTSLLFGAGLAGLGKVLKKSRIARRASKSFKKVRQKLFENMEPGFLKCVVLRAEPVDIRDGSVSVEHEDFSIPGRLPLTWTRRYSSVNAHAGLCGHGWQTPADIRLEIEPDGTVLFVDASSTAVFPQLPAGEGIEHAVREFVDGARLFRDGDGLWVRTKEGLRYGFVAGPANVAALQPQALPIERIEDLCGNHWRFERRDGQLVRIVESGVDGLQGRYLDVQTRRGLIERLQLHDPATGISHPLVSYRHDGGGDLVAASDALDAALTFEYQQHRLLRHTDRVGLSFYYAYNARWQAIHAWGDGGLHDYRFRYDSALNETEITDSLGHVSLVKFDDNGLPLCEIDPLDGVTVFEYDEVGRTTAVVDPMGLRTEFAYDDRGNALKLTRADGSQLQVRYDEEDRSIETIEPDGATWARQWDKRGLLRAQCSPLGATTRYDYDHHGQLHSVTNALGASTLVAFDRHGQLACMTDPLGHANRFEHDAMGRLICHVDVVGAMTRYHHDAKGRVVRVLLPGGGELHHTFDAEDRLLRHVDAAGAVTRLEYAGTGQLSRRVQPDGHAVHHLYDTEERLVAFVNQRGERCEFEFDPLGRIVREVDYWGQARHYRFDAGGRLIETIDPSGQVVTCSNDRLGRITARHMDDTLRPGHKVQETFRYDRCGQLVEMRSAHRLVQRVFDAERRLVEERQDGFRISNTYDALGNRVLRETSAGNRVAQQFDVRGLVSAITINDGSPMVIERDALGRIVGERMGERLQRLRRYNALGLPASETVLVGQTTAFETAYDFDRSGNMTRRSDSQHGAEAFAYDPIGRLLAHTDAAGRSAQFLHDPAGGRMTTHVQEVRLQQAAGAEGHAPGHWAREGSWDGQDYSFDRAGNLVRRRRTTSRPGNPGEEDGLQLRWDGNHRLVESRGDGVTTHYGYDALGRRAFKRGPTHTTWFFWDGDALLGEVREGNAQAHGTVRATGTVADLMAARKRRESSASLHARVREFIYYPGSFVPLALVDRRSSASSRRQRAVTAAASPQAPCAAALVAAPQPGAVMRSGLLPVAPSSAAAGGLACAPPAKPIAMLAPVSSTRSASGLGFGGLGGLALGGREPVHAEPSQTRENAVSTAVPVSDGDAALTRLGCAEGMTQGPSRGLAVQAEGLSDTATPSSSSHAGPAGTASGTDRHADAPVTSQPLAPSPEGAVPEDADDREVFHYHVDPNGLPVRLFDDAGHVVWSASYATWGAIACLHADEVDNPLRYQGQYHDAETGLSYNRFRYYDPHSGQYVTQDPLRLVGGDDLYAYGINPVGWIDPLGLKKCPTAAQEAAMKKATWEEYTGMKGRIGKKKRGPCFSIAVDLKTGKMSKVYTNNLAGYFPSDLHPSINERMSSVPPYRAHNGEEISKGPGTHSEIYAVNELLNARKGATLSDIAVWSMESYGKPGVAIGDYKEACPHCEHLLDGVHFVK
ncbi:RHS repeat-associated core domain-containing protein [Montanilutibacter psychrotolerans]|nr:RHS repeat-associated core domain-containing protein [Lysobacter psychrotolerans]